MELGVCFYPEHWPSIDLKQEFRSMRMMGITHVRMGEFSWSRIEPKEGIFQFGWLDEAMDAASNAQMKITLGTPTATPPNWLIQKYPEILAIDAQGQVRKFGSRRHYCFSSKRYREESQRILNAVAYRYANHPALFAWQTDNEYGCHDTVLSYSQSAREGFQDWLEKKYGTIDKLNEAWGNVFWSMEYGSFDQIDLPSGTVTEPNPSHSLDFQRYSSDMVREYNRLQVKVLKSYNPDILIQHNFMGHFTQFDHFDLGKDLDFATWDSYPLGFLEQEPYEEECKHQYFRTGHPDFSCFHHDLYRSVGRKRFWVMEQQSGPVNWAPFNPAPLHGMVKLWAFEAMFHGAEVMSIFRWRQVPYAQEQMHSGLLRVDGTPTPAIDQLKEFLDESGTLGNTAFHSEVPTEAALIFDYPSCWIHNLEPKACGFDYFQLQFSFYTALRELGLNVDIISKEDDFTKYQVLFCPALTGVDPSMVTRILQSGCSLFAGPRTGSKTSDFQIPPDLPPGALQEIFPLKAIYSESLRRSVRIAVLPEGHECHSFREILETKLEPLWTFEDGPGCLFDLDSHFYLSGVLDQEGIKEACKIFLDRAGIKTVDLPKGTRIRKMGRYLLVTNYGPDPSFFLPEGYQRILGKKVLGPGELAVYLES